MPSSRDCCVCSQIEGCAASDLIAGMLPGQPYVRRVMSESDAFAAIPSLGPLVPGHSLLCPRAHLRSISELTLHHESEYRHAKAALRGRLSALYGADVHVFEHGMARGGMRTLCTVEHAHVHFVPMSPACAVELGPDPRWTRFDGSLQQLRHIAAGREYIAYEAPDGDARVLAAGEGELESQYMRKVIARALGRPERWDWRAEPDAAAADAAWRRFIAHPVRATR